MKSLNRVANRRPCTWFKPKYMQSFPVDAVPLQCSWTISVNKDMSREKWLHNNKIGAEDYETLASLLVMETNYKNFLAEKTSLKAWESDMKKNFGSHLLTSEELFCLHASWTKMCFANSLQKCEGQIYVCVETSQKGICLQDLPKTCFKIIIFTYFRNMILQAWIILPTDLCQTRKLFVKSWNV